MQALNNSESIPCVKFSNIYLDPLLCEPRAARNAAARRKQTMLLRTAAEMCATCPLLAQCLVEAVADHDVSGFVAGTTAHQRQQIRIHLDITIEVEDFDTYAGVNSGRQFDTSEILRLRKANPTDSLREIAERVGCSVSTVKRHLRRGHTAERCRDLARATPTPAEILAVAEKVKASHQEQAA